MLAMKVRGNETCFYFRITIAMKEHDSTVIYYRMIQGLVPPDSPESTRRKKQLNEQKRFIEGEVRRMQHKWIEMAHNARFSGEVKMSTGTEREIGHSATSDDQPHISRKVTEEGTKDDQEQAPNEDSSGRTLAMLQQ
jgi:hypothetical protein